MAFIKRFSSCVIALLVGAGLTAVYGYQPQPPPQPGNGVGGGIGSGKGDGVGRGSGPSATPPGVFRIGGGVSAPVPIFKPQPQYSEEARASHIEGEVRIQLVVDETGHPINMKIVKALGSGLDEAALNSVAQWTFKPGTKDGMPVPVIATIAVTFRLANPPPTAK